MKQTKQFNGAIPSPKDPRQIRYEDIVFGALPPDMPRKYNVEKKFGKATRIDQGSSLSCVANGTTRYKEIKDQKETGKEVRLSSRFIYSLYHLANGGMYVRDGMKCLQKFGVPEESVFPTIKDDITETWMRYKGDLTDEVYKNAEIYKIKSYAEICTLDPELIARAIWENDGCICGIKPINASIGHLIFWSGYDLDAQTFNIVDSYPPHDKIIYYRNGKFYYNDPNYQINIFDVYTCVDLDNQTLSDLKNLMLLRRNPYNTNDVYAINENVRHLITNKQSLKLGAEAKDRLWIWAENDIIPVATLEEWNRTEEGFEILLLPSDSSVGAKFGAFIYSFFKRIKEWLTK